MVFENWKIKDVLDYRQADPIFQEFVRQAFFEFWPQKYPQKEGKGV